MFDAIMHLKLHDSESKLYKNTRVREFPLAKEKVTSDI